MGESTVDSNAEEARVATAAPQEQEVVVPTPNRRRRWWWAGGIVVVVAAVVAGFMLVGNGSDGADDTQQELSFADVVRTDLVQTDSYDGTLGTEDGDPVTSPVSGVVTTTAEVGTTIEQGDVFLTVDNQPVVLLYGELPAYRALARYRGQLRSHRERFWRDHRRGLRGRHPRAG